MLIDTPGLRELMPYGDVAFVDMTFKEISDAALNSGLRTALILMSQDVLFLNFFQKERFPMRDIRIM